MNLDEVLSYEPSLSVAAKDDDDQNGEDTIEPNASKKRRVDFSLPPSTSSSAAGNLNHTDGLDIDKILELADSNAPVPEIDASTLKRLILQFERKVLKNQEMRIKHAESPERFMESEMELFDVLKEMHIIATQPSLYDLFISLNVVNTILGLLSHENTDVACAVVELLQELTDLDDVEEIDEVGKLMDVLLENQIIVLLINNMERLNESVKEESDGIYNSLGKQSLQP